MSLCEAATGLALVAVPDTVVRLLLGTAVTGAGIPLGRLAGIALLALGLACWPGKSEARPALRAMLTYNSLATLYLLFLGLRGEWVGWLLWPAVVLHAGLTLLLARAWFKATRSRDC
ncbi:MAG: hypothetical protein ACREJC_16120 [Tepidisphaeraceae bacterium]